MQKVNSLNQLWKMVEELKKERDESIQMQEGSELQIIKQRKEIQFLREEIEERRMREDKLNSELCVRINEFESLEAEAEKVYIDLQNCIFREVVLKDKVQEIALVCERLEDESDLKSREIEEIKGRVNIKENEIIELEAQLLAYAPFVVCVRENFASLEHNTRSLVKLTASNNGNQKVIYSHSAV